MKQWIKDSFTVIGLIAISLLFTLAFAGWIVTWIAGRFV